jgi:hypothetical protein
MVTEIITDTILILGETIMGVMIHFITIAGFHLLYSILTLETDGVIIITAGTAIIIIMGTMISETVTIQIIIIMVIIQTGILPRDTPHGGTLAITPDLQPIIIMYREGESPQAVMPEMMSAIPDL